jgi:hypothetical protein
MKPIYRTVLYFLSVFIFFNIVGLLLFHSWTNIQISQEIINQWVIKSLPLCLFSTTIFEMSCRWKNKRKSKLNKGHHEKPYQS